MKAALEISFPLRVSPAHSVELSAFAAMCVKDGGLYKPPWAAARPRLARTSNLDGVMASEQRRFGAALVAMRWSRGGQRRPSSLQGGSRVSRAAGAGSCDESHLKTRWAALLAALLARRAFFRCSTPGASVFRVSGWAWWSLPRELKT